MSYIKKGSVWKVAAKAFLSPERALIKHETNGHLTNERLELIRFRMSEVSSENIESRILQNVFICTGFAGT